MQKIGWIGLMLLPLLACEREEKDLRSFDDRVEEARKDLIDKLVEPASGWRLDYSPVDGSGSYLILLDFSESGTVRIQSDVSAEEGYYHDQTVPYRVDNASYVEVIFETYSVFHYLFELDQATFGAEFEFLYSGEEDGDLLFISKTDFGTPSTIRLTSTLPNAATLFSREVVANMQKFEGVGPSNEFGLPLIPTMQQAYFSDQDFSIYWELDQAKRLITFNKVITGQSLLGDILYEQSFTTGYSFESGALILHSPFSFSLDQPYTIEKLTMDQFSGSGGSAFCEGDTSAYPRYTGDVEGLGSMVLTNSLYSPSGESFVSGANAVYSINIPFIFDAELNSLADEGGLINQLFPTAQGFIFFFGVESESYPAYSMGFIVEDENGEDQFYLQEIDQSALEGNKLVITFKDSFYLSGTPADTVQTNLTTVLGTIFEGNTVYIYLTPAFGLNIFRLYNPCNKYEILLLG